MSVAARLSEVRDSIRRAERAAARPEGSVRLIAVSKSKPAEAIREAYEAGQRDFGENYVQELVAKAKALADLPDIAWHVIGPLQRNKAKAITPIAAWIHTIDRAELAVELDKRARDAGRTLRVLLEVNVAAEASKAGISIDRARDLREAVRACPHLRCEGLMTIPPDTDDRELARPVFTTLRDLARDLSIPELSMGMSHDFEIAIACGATMVRVGTAIFGARNVLG